MTFEKKAFVVGGSEQVANWLKDAPGGSKLTIPTLTGELQLEVTDAPDMAWAERETRAFLSSQVDGKSVTVTAVDGDAEFPYFAVISPDSPKHPNRMKLTRPQAVALYRHLRVALLGDTSLFQGSIQ